MNCFCCRQDIALGRKVMIRQLVDYDPSRGGPGSSHYMVYQEETTYRWSVVCNPCYIQLDNEIGSCEINGKKYTIAVKSRRDKARTYDEKAYQEWQKKEAAKLGIDLSTDI